MWSKVVSRLSGNLGFICTRSYHKPHVNSLKYNGQYIVSIDEFQKPLWKMQSTLWHAAVIYLCE